jgi:DNA helicase IV
MELADLRRRLLDGQEVSLEELKEAIRLLRQDRLSAKPEEKRRARASKTITLDDLSASLFGDDE